MLINIILISTWYYQVHCVSYLVKTLYYIIGTNGTIELVNYEKLHLQQWEVNPSCDYVKIKSTHFDTEECCDILSIGELHYSGNGTVDTIVSGSFNVSFRSNSSSTNGFKLQWSCVSMKMDMFNFNGKSFRKLIVRTSWNIVMRYLWHTYRVYLSRVMQLLLLIILLIYMYLYIYSIIYSVLFHQLINWWRQIYYK